MAFTWDQTDVDSFTMLVLCKSLPVASVHPDFLRSCYRHVRWFYQLLIAPGYWWAAMIKADYHGVWALRLLRLFRIVRLGKMSRIIHQGGGRCRGERRRGGKGHSIEYIRYISRWHNYKYKSLPSVFTVVVWFISWCIGDFPLWLEIPSSWRPVSLWFTL